MTAATLTEAPDVARAVEDSDYYADTLATLSRTDRAWFTAQVEAAWNATHQPQTIGERDVRILQFAPRLSQYRTPADIEQAINAQFGISAVRYHKLLGQLINRSDVARAYPELVARLKAQREARQAARTARNVTEQGAQS